jgi:hypothetical protein
MRKPQIPYHKLPHFVTDIFDELRDRHLLPVVIALAVATVAIPVLLSSSSESPPPAPDVAAELAAPESDSVPIAVLAEDAGLRRYKQRLNRLSPKDPFKQQYQTSVTGAAELGGSVAVTLGDEGGTGSAGFGNLGHDDSGSDSDPVPGGTSPGSGGGSPPKAVSYRIDVFAGEQGATKRRDGVKPLTSLPGNAKPVVVFLDASPDRKKALFMVSSQAILLPGGGTCILEDGTACQVMSLRPKLTASFTYGIDGKTYKLRVVRIKRAVK